MEKGVPHRLLGGGKMRGAAGLAGLQKQNSWSPDIERDEAWERRRRGLLRKAPPSSSLSRAQSVTDDDLDELRGCLDLGFGFEPPAAVCAACGEGRTRLVETLPALDLYYAVAAKGGGGGGGGGNTEGAAAPCTCGASSEASEPSPIGSPLSILSPGTYLYSHLHFSSYL
jgi:hypothetical protein